MCFGGKPKLKQPKLQQPKINQPAPIADQTPTVTDGAEAADTQRATKRAANPNSGLSLFQIQLIPGATTTSGDEPGAGTGG